MQSKATSIDELKDKLKMSSPQKINLDTVFEKDLIIQLRKEPSDSKIKQKRFKVRDSAKLKILRMHFKENLSRDQISNILFIPYSTISRVIREFDGNPEDSCHWFESKTLKVCESEVIARSIRAYVQGKKDLFNSSDISKHIRQTYNVLLQKRSIIEFLKDDMNMTYKKVSSRPLQAILEINQVFKSLF